MLNDSIFKLHRCLRERHLQFFSKYSPEQLALIPTGFKNNLLWNAGHIIVTQQLYCYFNSGLPMYVDEDFIAKYRKGTAPDGSIPSLEEIELIKELMISTQEKMEVDYKNGLFKGYTDYVTGINFPLHNAEDAIEFNVSHEGSHLGTVIALSYFIK